MYTPAPSPANATASAVLGALTSVLILAVVVPDGLHVFDEPLPLERIVRLAILFVLGVTGACFSLSSFSRRAAPLLGNAIVLSLVTLGWLFTLAQNRATDPQGFVVLIGMSASGAVLGFAGFRDARLGRR